MTCTRHFDYQISQFIFNFPLSKAQPLGNISDWFYRVEYQQRGSPHIHMLIWLEDAPVFHVNTLQLHVLSFEISHTLSRSNEQQPTPCTSQCIISFMLCKSTCKTSVSYWLVVRYRKNNFVSQKFILLQCKTKYYCTIKKLVTPKIVYLFKMIFQIS